MSLPLTAVSYGVLCLALHRQFWISSTVPRPVVFNTGIVVNVGHLASGQSDPGQRINPDGRRHRLQDTCKGAVGRLMSLRAPLLSVATQPHSIACHAGSGWLVQVSRLLRTVLVQEEYTAHLTVLLWMQTSPVCNSAHGLTRTDQKSSPSARLSKVRKALNGI